MEFPREIQVGTTGIRWIPGAAVVDVRDKAGRVVSIHLKDLPNLCAELLRLFAIAFTREPK